MVREALEAIGREVDRHRPEVRVDVDRLTLARLRRPGAHEQHAVLLDRRQAHQAVAGEIQPGESTLSVVPKSLPALS